VPAVRGQPLPIVESRDAVSGEIEVSPPPDRQCSYNAVIVALVLPDKPKLAPVAAKTFAVEDESDAVSPGTPSATQLAYDSVGNCVRPAEAATQARCRLGK
jgi:hypothetical protein